MRSSLLSFVALSLALAAVSQAAPANLDGPRGPNDQVQNQGPAPNQHRPAPSHPSPPPYPNAPWDPSIGAKRSSPHGDEQNLPPLSPDHQVTPYHGDDEQQHDGQQGDNGFQDKKPGMPIVPNRDDNYQPSRPDVDRPRPNKRGADKKPVGPKPSGPPSKGAKPSGPFPKGPKPNKRDDAPKASGQPPMGKDGKPLGPPPMGKDGKPMGPPPMGKDGKPLGPPPMGKDGKPLGPPPMGKDGKPLGPPPQGSKPSKRDDAPKPSGQPPMGQDGKPMGPLPMGKDGKPIGPPPMGKDGKPMGPPPKGGKPPMNGQGQRPNKRSPPPHGDEQNPGNAYDSHAPQQQQSPNPAPLKSNGHDDNRQFENSGRPLPQQQQPKEQQQPQQGDDNKPFLGGKDQKPNGPAKQLNMVQSS